MSRSPELKRMDDSTNEPAERNETAKVGQRDKRLHGEH